MEVQKFYIAPCSGDEEFCLWLGSWFIANSNASGFTYFFDKGVWFVSVASHKSLSAPKEYSQLIIKV